MPRLSDLFAAANITPVQVTGDRDVLVTSIVADSRQVTPGALFVAIAGVQQHGMHYADAALQQGAVAVVMQASESVAWTAVATLIVVADVRAAVAALAAAFYPEQPAHNYAITGTDGKTSTADFVRQLVVLSGQSSASLGTLGLRSAWPEMDAHFPANNTSPEPILLHRTLQQLAQAGAQQVAIEASSHGLDQKRLDGVRLTAAAFTNLTRDHLDYHGTVEAYARAKMRLFAELLPAQATAVVNRDDAQFLALQEVAATRALTLKSFGYHADADYRLMRVTPHAQGLDAVLQIDGKIQEISLPLYGAFQLMNMLAAVGLLQASGLAVDALLALLPQLQGVSGRLEKVATTASGAPIFVDYAHTPAALENILKTLRAHTQQRLLVVFGCGGDRDVGKRPEMGRAAAQYADRVIITDDNPRSEDPAQIRAAIAAACPGAEVIADRAKAIDVAVQQLQAGDVLVVAGKGHEQTQIIGAEVIHFSDAEEIQRAVRNQ